MYRQNKKEEQISFVSFFRGFAFLTRVYVEYSLQNRFVFLISLFGLSAILKIRNGEHAHYVGLVVAYTWNREKQMFVALGKEFDMLHRMYVTTRLRSKMTLFSPYFWTKLFFFIINWRVSLPELK